MQQYKSYNLANPPRIGYIFSIIGFAMIFGIISVVLLTPLLNLAIADTTYRLFATQIISALATMLLPVWLTETYFRQKHFTYLFRAKISDLNWYWILYGVLLLLAVIPIVSASSYLMEQIPIPTLLEETMAELDALLDDTYDLFLLEKRPLGIVLSLLSIVIVAPIAEEYLFRGAIQGWILSNTKNAHTAVWITAFIFSLIHMQWSGFLARFILGTILGYVAIYGGIWMAIFLHFLNNFSTFLVNQLSGKEELLGTPATMGEYIQLVVLSICAIGIIYFVFRWMKARSENELKSVTKDYEYEN